MKSPTSDSPESSAPSHLPPSTSSTPGVAEKPKFVRPRQPVSRPAPLQEAAGVRSQKVGARAGAGAVPVGRYDAGQTYGTVRYAVGDPLPPVDDGGVVKLGIAKMNNNDLVAFLNSHIACMTANAFYPTPLPAAADFLAAVTAYSDSVTAAIAAETALRDANTVRDSQRALIQRIMKGRAGYVQEASNGNRAAIVSSGLGLVNPKTPVTFLPAPVNLRVDLNGEAGLMKIRWDKVPYAMTYDLQCCVNTLPRVWETLQSSTQTTALKTMEVGVAYVFRVCAVGSPGRSNWSPEVVRGAA